MRKKHLGLDKEGIQRVMHQGDYLADMSGQLALSLMANLVGQLTYFYTDKVGLAVGMVGIMMAIAKVFDAFTDIWFGSIIDHSKGGNRKYYRWMKRVMIPAAVSVILLFTVPVQLGQWPGLIYVLVTNCLLTAVCYTIIATPFSAVMVVRTKSQEERSQMGIYRAVANYLGGMITVLVTIPMTNALGGTQNAWIKYGVIIAAAVFLLFMICYHNGSHAQMEEITREQEEKEENVPLKDACTMLFHNRYWVMVLFFNVITSVTNTIASSSSAYYCKWIFNNDNLVTLLGGMGFAGTIVGFLISGKVIDKLGIRKTIFASTLGAALTAAIRCIRPANLVMYAVTSLLGSVVQIPLMCLYGVLLAMAVDYNEYSYDKKLVAVSSGAIGFGSKVGGGLGTVLLTAILALAHYDGTAVVATSSVKMAIYGFSNIIPIIINLLTFVVFLKFDLEQKLPEIHRELEQRHKQQVLQEQTVSADEHKIGS